MHFDNSDFSSRNATKSDSLNVSVVNKFQNNSNFKNATRLPDAAESYCQIKLSTVKIYPVVAIGKPNAFFSPGFDATSLYVPHATRSTRTPVYSRAR